MNTAIKQTPRENSNNSEKSRDVKNQSEENKGTPSVGNPPYNEEFKAGSNVNQKDAASRENVDESADDENRRDPSTAQDTNRDANQKSAEKSESSNAGGNSNRSSN